MKMMDGIILGIAIASILGIVMVTKSATRNSDIALKLSNMMNSSMLDCVTKQIISKDQVHDIETIFHKHIEENFKGIKASHGDEEKSKWKVF